MHISQEVGGRGIRTE